MAVAANRYYLLPEWGLLRGFQYLWTPRPVPVISGHGRRYALRNGLRKLLNIDGVAHDFDRDTVSAEEVNRAAFARLADSRQRQTPFFLFLNYMDAHLPYLPPAPFDTMYPGRDRRFASWEYDQITKRVNEGSQRLEPHEWAHLVSQYDGAIAYIDYALGELVRYLKCSGQYDRTMIVITSDHGEALGERGLMGHNVTLYQDQVHVALVIKYPRPAPSRVIDDLASQVDLLPTMLEVAGLPAPRGLPGTSLLHLAAASGRTVMSERHGDPPVAGGGGQSRIQYAALSGFSKLIC